MALYENFPYTNLHELNLDWLIQQLNNITSSTVLSVNGQTGAVTLYESQDVQFPNIGQDDWSIIRLADGTTRGIYFDPNGDAYIIHGNTMSKLYSSDNPPAYPVSSVNGQTGAVMLYTDQYVQLPGLDDVAMQNWTIFRNLNNVARGIQFNDDGTASIINGGFRYQIYTSNNPPTYPVDSVNGQTGTVVLFTDSNGAVSFPSFNDNNYDGWMLLRSVNNVNMGLVFHDDGTLDFKVGPYTYKVYTANDPQQSFVSDLGDSVMQVSENATDDYWGLIRTTTEGDIGLVFNNSDPDSPVAYIAYTDSNNQGQTLQLLTPADIPASSVVSVNGASGIVVLTGEDIKIRSGDNTDLDDYIDYTKSSVAYYEPGANASRNISQGDYVIWQNAGYVASQNISVGDTLSLSNLTALPQGIVNDLNRDTKSLFKLETYSCTYTIAAGANKSFSTADFNITIPTGYEPMALESFYTGNAGCYPYYIRVNSIGTANNIFGVHEIAGTNHTDITATLSVVYIKQNHIVP